MRRVAVTGGRNYGDYRTVAYVLAREHKDQPFDVLICGMARGADSLCATWAHANSVTLAEFPADWDRHGRAAGPIRNQQMIDEGKPTELIAFPGGKGTADMTQRCRAAKLKILEVKK